MVCFFYVLPLFVRSLQVAALLCDIFVACEKRISWLFIFELWNLLKFTQTHLLLILMSLFDTLMEALT